MLETQVQKEFERQLYPMLNAVRLADSRHGYFVAISQTFCLFFTYKGSYPFQANQKYIDDFRMARQQSPFYKEVTR